MFRLLLKSSTLLVRKSTILPKMFCRHQSSLKSPTPLTIQMMKLFGETPANMKVRLTTAKFLCQELPIRYNCALEILRTLPVELSNTHGILELISLYTSCLQRVLSMQPPRNEEEDSNFTGILSIIQKDLQHVYPLMAWGVNELKEKRIQEGNPIQLFEEELLSSALDEFVLYHISGVVILAQHVVSLTKKGGRIQRFAPENTISLAIDRAIHLTKEHYGCSPEVHMQVVTQPGKTFEYIPTHIHHMSFELLKNSLRASIENTIHKETRLPISQCTPPKLTQELLASLDVTKIPPVDVIISQGDTDLSVKVSDLGGGVTRDLVPRLFLYTSTTAFPPSWIGNPNIVLENIPIMRDHYAGLGYGLPVAKVYAQYFGGDLQLFSMEGWGTDAYIHVRRLADMKEVIF
ncbi:hypothetical protein WA158_004408 [Blastocystis sp. Blastoise]